MFCNGAVCAEIDVGNGAIIGTCNIRESAYGVYEPYMFRIDKPFSPVRVFSEKSRNVLSEPLCTRGCLRAIKMAVLSALSRLSRDMRVPGNLSLS